MAALLNLETDNVRPVAKWMKCDDAVPSLGHAEEWIRLPHRHWANLPVPTSTVW